MTAMCYSDAICTISLEVTRLTHPKFPEDILTDRKAFQTITSFRAVCIAAICFLGKKGRVQTWLQNIFCNEGIIQKFSEISIESYSKILCSYVLYYTNNTRPLSDLKLFLNRIRIVTNLYRLCYILLAPCSTLHVNTWKS